MPPLELLRAFELKLEAIQSQTGTISQHWMKINRNRHGTGINGTIMMEERSRWIILETNWI